MKHLRKSNSSTRSLPQSYSINNSLKKLALSKGGLGSQIASSKNISQILSFNSKGNMKQSAGIPLAPNRNRAYVVPQNQRHETYGINQDYFIQTGIYNQPIIEHNSKKNRKPFNFKRHLDYMPLQMGHFCFHKSDRRLQSLPIQIKKCLSEKMLGIRPTTKRSNKRKIRLEDRTHREPYPDSRPHIISDKVQYSICRVPSPSFVRTGLSGEHKITRLGSEVSIKQIGSMIQNPARYTLTKFDEPSITNRARSPLRISSQSPNLSPRSLSPVTSRIIIANQLSQSFGQPFISPNMRIEQLPLYSPRTSRIQSPPLSPKSSHIMLNNNLPPLSPRQYHPIVVKIQPTLKNNLSLPVNQIEPVSPRNSSVLQRPIIKTSQVSDSSQDLLSSQVSGSGIITNLKSFSLKTAASSGMFTRDSIRQMDQYQLDANKNSNNHFRYSNTSIRS